MKKTILLTVFIGFCGYVFAKGSGELVFVYWYGSKTDDFTQNEEAYAFGAFSPKDEYFMDTFGKTINFPLKQLIETLTAPLVKPKDRLKHHMVSMVGSDQLILIPMIYDKEKVLYSMTPETYSIMRRKISLGLQKSIFDDFFAKDEQDIEMRLPVPFLIKVIGKGYIKPGFPEGGLMPLDPKDVSSPAPVEKTPTEMLLERKDEEKKAELLKTVRALKEHLRKLREADVFSQTEKDMVRLVDFLRLSSGNPKIIGALDVPSGDVLFVATEGELRKNIDDGWIIRNIKDPQQKLYALVELDRLQERAKLSWEVRMLAEQSRQGFSQALINNAIETFTAYKALGRMPVFEGRR